MIFKNPIVINKKENYKGDGEIVISILVVIHLVYPNIFFVELIFFQRKGANCILFLCKSQKQSLIQAIIMVLDMLTS